jgi:hypothetical protein
MVEFIFYIFFPWIGALVLWLLNFGQKKYTDLLELNQELLAIIGGISVSIIILIVTSLLY